MTIEYTICCYILRKQLFQDYWSVLWVNLCPPPPTKPKVAILMRTEGGNTVLKAVKQAPRVLPVVNT